MLELANAQNTKNPQRETVNDLISSNKKQFQEEIKDKLPKINKIRLMSSDLVAKIEASIPKLIKENLSKNTKIEVNEIPSKDLIRSILPQFSPKLLRATLIIKGTVKAHLYKILTQLERAEEKFLMLPDHIVANGIDNVQYWDLQDQDPSSAAKDLVQMGLKTDQVDEARDAIRNIYQMFRSKDLDKFRKLLVSPTYEDISFKKLISALEVQYSPTWIVATEDKLYLFEGDFDPTEFLNIINDPSNAKQPKGDIFHRRFKREGVPFVTNLQDEKESNVASHFMLNKKIRDAVPQPEYKIQFRKLNPCSKPDIRRTKVGMSTLIFQSPVDIIIYSESDQQTAQRLNNWQGAKVKYPVKGGRLDESDPTSNLLVLADKLDLRCLPTRFLYSSENSVVYQEFREGEAIWKK